MKFQLEQTNELLTTHTGLAIVEQLLSQTKLTKRLNKIPLAKAKNPHISHAIAL
ncbi:MAG: hypothetical protein PWR14_649 [Thermosediminibacterales bacterium]|jgi:hypothetical protein|nr:hypothetical protein [Thermosediminibacterales bacterium]